MAEVENFGMAPGNWLAQEIRRFQEESKGLFPAPRPGDEKIRYNTIYGLDYAPLAKVSIYNTVGSGYCK